MIVDTIPIFKKLNTYFPLPCPLRDHLGQVLSQKYYLRGRLLLRPGQVPRYAWFIRKGAARGYILDEQKGAEITVWFWYEGDVMLALDSFCRQIPTGIYIEVLEDSVLQCLSYQALEHTCSLFPVFRYLERAVLEESLFRVCRHYHFRSIQPSKARFEKLMAECPQLFNLAQVKDIASFLGMYPDTLSRLRSSK